MNCNLTALTEDHQKPRKSREESYSILLKVSRDDEGGDRLVPWRHVNLNDNKFIKDLCMPSRRHFPGKCGVFTGETGQDICSARNSEVEHSMPAPFAMAEEKSKMMRRRR